LGGELQQFGRYFKEPLILDILIPASAGELIDKITILEIKLKNIVDPVKNRNVSIELEALSKCFEENIIQSNEIEELKTNLKQVNSALWNIEDDIRQCEQAGEFGEKFVELARSVYRQNDKRAALKKEINIMLGSSIIEEKSYADYQ
jgi:hypothetical protein|tara:strand:- start:319 stop:759 length:441 start_codon:yes stop_codon:yes gene_type:complete